MMNTVKFLPAFILALFWFVITHVVIIFLSVANRGFLLGLFFLQGALTLIIFPELNFLMSLVILETSILIPISFLIFLSVRLQGFAKLLLVVLPILDLIAILMFFRVAAAPFGFEGFGGALEMGVLVYLLLVTIPVLTVIWAVSKAGETNLAQLFRQSLPVGLIVIFVFSILTVGSLKIGAMVREVGGRVEFEERQKSLEEESKKKEVEQLAEIESKILKVTYLPKGINPQQTAETTVTGSTTEYRCEKGQRSGSGLVITQESLDFSVERLDFTEGIKDEGGIKTLVQKIEIGGQPALYKEKDLGAGFVTREIVWDQNGVRVKIWLASDCQIDSPKEELIKVANSMK